MFRKIEILYLKKYDSAEKFIAPKCYYLKMSLSEIFASTESAEKSQFQKPKKQTIREMP